MLNKSPQKHIILLRHAKTEVGKGKAIGHTHVPLSDVGKAQAENFSLVLQKLIRRNANEQRTISLYSSPSQRALESYGHIYEKEREKITIIPECQEIFLGDWEGLPFDIIKKQWPELYEERGRDMAHFRPPFGDACGENFQDVQKRMIQVLESMKQYLNIQNTKDTKQNHTAIIIAHAGSMRALLCHFLGIALENIMHVKVGNLHGYILACHDNGSISLVEPCLHYMDIEKYL